MHTPRYTLSGIYQPTYIVLVCLGESKKQVSFECCEDADEAFTDAMLYEFSDVSPSPSPPLIIQLKDAQWEGSFQESQNSSSFCGESDPWGRVC